MSKHSPVDAIAYIRGNDSWGTGFLVRAADRRLLVLTAGHLADDPPLEVTFATRKFTSAATVARRDKDDADSPLLRGTSDWAALECTLPLPSDLAPIELDDFDGPPTTPFETFGYPKLYGYPGDGGPLHGVVRRGSGDEIRPFCHELDHGRDPDYASGISGAPCLVADVAVGVITNVLAHGGTTVGGTILLVLASTIARESDGLFKLATDPGLPYLPDTELPLAALNAGLLQRMVKALELEPVAGQQADALRRRVARGLLIAEPEQVAHALVSVKDVGAVREAAAQLVVQRESLGIMLATVRGALRLFEPRGAVALNATLEVSARLLLRRVSWVLGYEARWYLPANCLVVVPDADNETAVVNAVRRAARQQFLCPDPDSVLNSRVMFAAIYKTLPRPTTRKALADAFPELRIIFCSERPSDAAAPPMAAEWLSLFTVNDECQWRTKCLSARSHLRHHAAISLDDDHFDRMG